MQGDSVIAKATRAERKLFLFIRTRRLASVPAHSPVIFEVHSYDLSWPAQTSQYN